MGNDNGNTVFSRCGGLRMANAVLTPRKPVCGAADILAGCSFRLGGKDGSLWRTSTVFGMRFPLPVVASMLPI